MRKRKYLLLILVFLNLTIIGFNADRYHVGFASSSSSPLTLGISTLGTIIYPTFNSSLVIRRQVYENWRFSPQLSANTSDLWIGHWNAVSEAAQIKQVRPDFLAFLYANIKERFSDGPNDPPGTFDLFKSNGWLLKDATGTYLTTTVYPGSYIVDVGNLQVQQWYANWIKSYLDNYGLDGVQLDNCLPSNEILYGTAPSNPINPRTGNVWTDQEFNDAVISFVNTVKDTIGSRIVLGNGVWNGNHFYNPAQQQGYTSLLLNSKIDGVISEGWMGGYDLTGGWPGEGDWRNTVDFTVWVQTNLLAKRTQGIFIPICACAGEFEDPLPDGTYPTALPSGVTKEQYAIFCFASLLMAANQSGNLMDFGYYMTQDYPQSLFEINLGNSLGAYYIVNGTHVYARDFSNTKALVNPTSNSYLVNLEANYETLNGTKLTSPITVAPHTGIILRRSGP